MNQSCISNSVQRINNNYFLEEFNKSRIPRRHKSLGKKIRDRKISLRAYNEITSKFLDIFYNEVYYLDKPSYFFLGGFIEKRRTSPGVKTIGRRDENSERKRVMVEFPITLLWSELFFVNRRIGEIKYVKLKGSTNMSNKIEKDWLSKNNYYDLRKA